MQLCFSSSILQQASVTKSFADASHADHANWALLNVSLTAFLVPVHRTRAPGLQGDPADCAFRAALAKLIHLKPSSFCGKVRLGYLRWCSNSNRGPTDGRRNQLKVAENRTEAPSALANSSKCNPSGRLLRARSQRMTPATRHSMPCDYDRSFRPASEVLWGTLDASSSAMRQCMTTRCYRKGHAGISAPPPRTSESRPCN